MRPVLDERFFPLIFDSISHGIFTIDSEGGITSFNRAAEELTGYRSEEVLGQTCSSIFQTELCKTRCPLKSSIHTGRRSEDQEVVITTKSGDPLPVAVSTAALVDERKNIIGGVEMFRDLRLVAELRKRLVERGTEEGQALQKRIRRAEQEIRNMAWYKYIIINDVFEEAARQLSAIVEAERCGHSHGFIEELLSERDSDQGPDHHRP